MTQEKKNRFESRLTEEDKQTIIDTIVQTKKNQPQLSWKEIMTIARASVPEERTFAASVMHPTASGWIRRGVEKAGISITAHTSDADDHKKRSFAKTFYELRKTNPDWSINQLVRETNRLLPAEYRVGNTYNSLNQLKWLVPELEKLETVDLIKEKGIPVVAPEPEKVAQSQPEVKSIAADDIPEPCPEPAPAVSTSPSLETALITAIVGVVKPMIMDILQSPQFSMALHQAFVQSSVMPKSTPLNPEYFITPEPVREIKPKVLIVGLLPQQAQEIQQLYGKRYDLRIFDSNVTSDKIRSLMPHCERAIVMTKFISHRVQDVLRGHAGFTHCNGSVTALKELLNTRNGH